jgi:hypothetical protein
MMDKVQNHSNSEGECKQLMWDKMGDCEDTEDDTDSSNVKIDG